MAVEFFEESNLVHCNVGHQLLFDALVTSFTAETLVVCSEHREPARFDHQQYLDDSHGKGLSMAQSVRTLDGGWIFEKEHHEKKWAKKSSQKTNTNGFLYQHPSRRVVFFLLSGLLKNLTPAAGFRYIGSLF